MALALAIAATVFSLVAALFAGLIFFRTKTSGVGASSSETTLADTIRSEADRSRQTADEQARASREELADTIERLRKGLADDIDRMGKDAAQNRDALRQTIEGRLDAAELKSTTAARDLRTELIANFSKTSEVLSKSLKDFGDGQGQRLDGVKNEVTGMSERQATVGEQLRKTVEERLDVLRQENSSKLDDMRQTVDEKLQTALEKRLGESFRTVSEQLERVYTGLGEMSALATGVGDLKKVLSNVKARGTLAEGEVGALLEQFLSPDQYAKNVQIKPGSSERVEYAVKFVSRDTDGPLLLPIDAKFPSEDYERIVHASDRGDVAAIEEATLALESRIRASAKEISDKYINPPTTTDFAILFLPTEGLFAEVLRRPGLQDRLQREYRVTIASPTTLAALLTAFQMGFRSLAIQKRSSEVWQLLGAIRTEFSEHGKVVLRLQKQLSAATNTIEALGTRTRAMNRKLQDVQTLPAVEAQTVLGLTTAVLASAEEEDSEEEPGGLLNIMGGETDR